MLRYASSELEVMPFTPTKVEAADRENMGFLLLYLLPLFTADLTKLHWETWIPAIGMFAVITATGYNYHFNPLIGLMGWHFYKVESKEGVTYVLITRKQLRSASSALKVGQLTEYILMDLGG